jgi:signal transduction histidine kinase
MARALQDRQGYHEQEIVIERPDGARRTALAHACPFLDEAGKVIGAVNILVDITERRRTEDALREADRRKSVFLAMLAHELRNPLAPIRNGLQIMRLANPDGAAVSQARAMMERQLGHMVRLIDDLLDLSRITNGKIELRRERMDLAAAVQDAIETTRDLINERGHTLAVTLPPQPVYVDGDRTRLAQVFANLLNNAAKYTENGGRVWLTAERHGSDAVVVVRDTGSGIPAEILPRIFDMFTQADRALERTQGGLGIGLTLVRALVEMHGGRVDAHSPGAGQGCEFVVRLPVLLSPGRRTSPRDGGDGRAHHSAPYRILVVDDNCDSAISLGLMLEIMGHEIRTAHDGLAAVDAAASFRPDVILLDIGLPKLNGYDACRRIRAQAWAGRTVLIAITGWGQEEDKTLAREAGFNFHMVKPVDPEALEKLLAGLLLSPA